MAKSNMLFALSVLAVGIFLLAYGLITAPVTNGPEIHSHYACDRVTKDIRPTDKYCFDPKTAPEAKTDFSNPLVYGGVAVVVIGGMYLASYKFTLID